MAGLDRLINLGVVSFLNSRPLIDGLDARTGLSLHYAVPSALPAMLRRGEVDAALVPVVDLARSAGDWRRISDACIASDGETLTVRVFSRVPPEQMTSLYVDPDSHTSVALAQLIWAYHFERRLAFRPMNAVDDLTACESVLLIGDKVVTAPLQGYEYEVDLGGAWKAWQGLPFVFAVWAAPSAARLAASGGGLNEADYGTLARQLEAARDRGVSRVRQLADELAPVHGWPVDLAEDYMLRRLSYRLTPRHLKGMQQFFDLAAQAGILPRQTEMVG